MTEQKADAIMAGITILMFILILVLGSNFIILLLAGGGISLGYAYFYQRLGINKYRNLAIFWGIIVAIYVLASLILT